MRSEEVSVAVIPVFITSHVHFDVMRCWHLDSRSQRNVSQKVTAQKARVGNGSRRAPARKTAVAEHTMFTA
jgi:hypothetical protein